MNIDQTDSTTYVFLRRGIGRSFFSVPPSAPSLAALALAISNSKPSRTKAVFSVMPVSFEALASDSSSILSIVLIHIGMPY